jgi:XTP/dITP diphosphohydrolase
VPQKFIGKLVIATHNAGKLTEMRDLLAPYGVTTIPAADLGLPEPEETGGTFIANAEIKARAAADRANIPALADDSGLCVEALDGAPGINSAPQWPKSNKRCAQRRQTRRTRLISLAPWPSPSQAGI